MNNEDALILAQYLKISKWSRRLRYNFSKLQHKVIDDTSNIVAWVASRRASKSYTAARKLIDAAIKNPNTYVLYLATSRKQARKIMWRPLKETLRRLHIPADISEVELTISLTNGATIWVSGAPDESATEAYRGLAYSLCILDECASLGNYIDYLADEVLGPALMETEGQLWLVGTPSDTLVGRFYDLTKDAKKNGNIRTEREGVTISIYHSDITQNPNFPLFKKWGIDTTNQEEVIKAAKKVWKTECIKKKWTESSSEAQRELFGFWVSTKGSNPYLISDKNYHHGHLDATKLHRVLGVDLGFKDSAAFVVIGYDSVTNKVYEISTTKIPGLSLSEIVTQAKHEFDLWQPEIMVCDPSAGGANLISELRKRYKFNSSTADKTKKAAYMELLGDAITNGIVLFRKDSLVVDELRKIVWNKTRTRESDSSPSDAHDAFLYAFRYCYHYIPTELTKPLTEEEKIIAAYDAEEKRREQEYE